MREIKFRAWHDGRMYKESKCEFLSGYGCMFNRFAKPDAPLMQYTGLKDKNSAEIYEGDILKREHCYAPDDQYDIAVVEYSDERLCFRFNSIEKHGIFFDTNHPNFRFEVIGNIYENPELLEEK